MFPLLHFIPLDFDTVLQHGNVIEPIENLIGAIVRHA